LVPTLHAHRSEAPVKRTLGVAASLAAGVGLMYFLDPTTGKRRRALARDQLVRRGHAVGQVCGSWSHDFANRAQGAAARLRRWRRPEQIPDDDVLLARVRARLGRFMEHPRAIEVTAREGCVTLRGTLAASESEIGRLIKAVRRVPGVVDVNAELDLERPTDASTPRGALAQRVDSLSMSIGRLWGKDPVVRGADMTPMLED